MRTQHTNHGAFLGATKQTLFQLPPPPPGIQWHRTDMWQEGDLPEGWRPLVAGEYPTKEDECIAKPFESEWRASNNWMDGSSASEVCHYRTRRPLTFTHEGKTWTWHRPGDPMPCDGGREVVTLLEDLDIGGTIRAGRFDWGQRDDGEQIIGWRYANEKTTVPLGPEDVPPCCAFRRKDEPMDYIAPTSVYVGGIYGHDEIVFRHTWEYLKEHYQINRSIPLTGKWNPDAWEPCSKEVLA